MKILFFVDTEYPGFSGSELERQLINCGARVYVSGRGVDLVVLLVEDADVERCVKKALHVADVYYYEMEGAPRVLRFLSPSGAVKAEMKFI
jgi:hypothetical protein